MNTEAKNCRYELIDMETLERVSPIIRNAAHPLRLRILDFLDHEGKPRTVSDITEATGDVGQAIVSQQLRILKDQGVLTAKREGNYIYYGIADRSVLLLLDCIRTPSAVVCYRTFVFFRKRSNIYMLLL